MCFVVYRPSRSGPLVQNPQPVKAIDLREDLVYCVVGSVPNHVLPPVLFNRHHYIRYRPPSFPPPSHSF